MADHPDDPNPAFAPHEDVAAADKLIAGAPAFKTWALDEVPLGNWSKIRTGIWEATPGTTRSAKGEALEFCHILSGVVDLTEALGEVTLLYFGTRGQTAPVIAKLPGIHPGLNGRSVRLTADPAALHLFHDGRSLLYRDGVDLPPYRPRATIGARPSA